MMAHIIWHIAYSVGKRLVRYHLYCVIYSAVTGSIMGEDRHDSTCHLAYSLQCREAFSMISPMLCHF